MKFTDSKKERKKSIVTEKEVSVKGRYITFLPKTN